MPAPPGSNESLIWELASATWVAFTTAVGFVYKVLAGRIKDMHTDSRQDRDEIWAAINQTTQNIAHMASHMDRSFVTHEQSREQRREIIEAIARLSQKFDIMDGKIERVRDSQNGHRGQGQ